MVNIITRKDFQGLQLDGSIGGAQHGGEGTNMKVHADFKINDNVQAFAHVWESYNTTALMTGLAGFGSGALVPSLYYAANGSVQPFAPTVSGNPLTYYFPDAQSVDTTSNFYRVSTGVKGSFSTEKMGDWDWSASCSHSQSEISNAYTNQINASWCRTILPA